MPFYPVLQHHVVESRSVTLSKAVTTGIIANVSECVNILKQTGEILFFVHTKGYLHKDLKENNVFLEGANHNLILIDFGNFGKVDIRAAWKHYLHIAPKLHRRDRQSTASDVYSFGALILQVLKDGKFNVPALKSTAKKNLSASPGKRQELKDVLKGMGL